MIMHRPVVIIGAGPAGLSLALSLSENGIRSIVVDREERLGGHARQWACMATDACTGCFVCAAHDLAADVESRTDIDLVLGHEFKNAVQIETGARRISITPTGGGKEVLLDASALALAVGFVPYDPTEKEFLGYGQIAGVHTLAEISALMRADNLACFFEGIAERPRIAFFQCIGSRDAAGGADYCSQYCCRAALRTALKLVHHDRDCDVTIFYVDLQVAGKFASTLQAEAVEKGIRLRQGVPGEITAGPDGLPTIVREEDGRNTRESYHRVVLSVGQRPGSDPLITASLPGLDRDAFGFFRERSLTGDGRTSLKGVYVTGTAAAPGTIEETILRGARTAAAIISDLKHQERL
ncbi:MAG: FAD-dependent oxidoreductase [Pseudomonadota bacterium]